MFAWKTYGIIVHSFATCDTQDMRKCQAKLENVALTVDVCVVKWHVGHNLKLEFIQVKYIVLTRKVAAFPIPRKIPLRHNPNEIL